MPADPEFRILKLIKVGLVDSTMEEIYQEISEVLPI